MIRKRIAQYSITAILLLLGYSTSLAQGSVPGGINQPPPEGPRLQFGLYAGGQLATPSAEFLTLPGIISCQGDSILFTSGSGGGFMVAGIIGLKPGAGEDFTSRLGINLKIGFSSSTTTFETDDEYIGPAITRSGELQSITSRYSIETTLSELRIEPGVTYQVSNDVPLTFGLGLNLGLLMNATYEQAEHINSPTDAATLVSTGGNIRNVRNGDIQETSSLLAGLTLGLGYNILLTPEISIRPEITGLLSFTSPVSDVSWNPNEVRGGLSFLYTLPLSQSTPLGKN